MAQAQNWANEPRIQKKQMREQTEAYVQAVYAAHPELAPPDPAPAAFDPYPLKSRNAIMPLNGIRKIAHEVSAKSGVNLAELRGLSQSKHFVRARWECFKRARNAGFSLTQIGNFFRRDHTTVLYGLRQMGSK